MKRKLTAILVFVMILSTVMPVQAFAAFEDFTDAAEHWGKDTLKKAFDESILQGYEGALRPDDPIITAEAMTVLMRVFRAEIAETLPELGIAEDKWYGPWISAAYEMGLVKVGANYEAGMKRQDAFRVIAEAFGLIEAEPDLTVLNAFSDSGKLTAENKAAAACLVTGGYVLGSGGLLGADDMLTRAEFVTMLYRFVDSTADETVKEGSFVLGGNRKLSNAKNVKNVYISCDTDTVYLRSVTAEQITVRSAAVEGSTISGVTAGRLFLAPKGEFTLKSGSSNNIATIAVGSVGGKVTVSERSNNIEVISENRTVEITSAPDYITVGGSGNNVKISSRNIDEIKIIGSGNTVELTGTGAKKIVLGGSNNTLIVSANVTDSFEITGTNCTVIANSKITQIDTYGDGAKISGTGTVKTLKVYNENYTCEAVTEEVTYGGLIGADVVVTAPATLPAEETLVLTATVTNAEIKDGYEAYWTIDGEKLESFVPNFAETTEFTLEYKYEYSYYLADTGKAEFTVTDAAAGKTASGSVEYVLENHPDEYYNGGVNILDTVQAGYIGDETLEWNLNNDYTQLQKEMWIAAKGFDSETPYLLWINTTYQKVNVFEMIDGRWQLTRYFICSTGAPWSPTPLGVTHVTYKQRGWWTDTYVCYPVVRFYPGSGYAFHSRTYLPGSMTKLKDARIGFPISAGCIRMYNEDVQWIYDTIPENTRVVVF